MMSRFSKNASRTEVSREQNAVTVHGKMLVMLVFICLLPVFGGGCSALLGKTKGPLDNLDTSGLKQAGYTFGEYGAHKSMTMDDGSPAIVLEVQNGKRHFEKVPITPGQSMFIGDLVRDAKLDKKIGRLQATILRPNGPNKPPIRMDVDFDDSGKRVMEGQNYSLRAGDHVVISHDERNMLAGMVPFMKK